ncbi:DUF2065 domain-containing protein [Spectribacter hydrogenoxidans]|uniref:DUF2065 domain-containing protein n=1 Tax=Spectribacter hydrogenoxidans TaxID=3075608 RepID=A0ABU3BXN6_9GAMM|nr:DUF2065 domain-containing protein [Salinisphaera sp. W335]MDT0634063.1 DUF2065 domain-containing protein [Salinisphaera sp. W335]
MWSDLVGALALVMVIEGLMPFLAPERWREWLLQIVTIDGRTLRVFGGVMIAIGLFLLNWVN